MYQVYVPSSHNLSQSSLVSHSSELTGVFPSYLPSYHTGQQNYNTGQLSYLPRQNGTGHNGYAVGLPSITSHRNLTEQQSITGHPTLTGHPSLNSQPSLTSLTGKQAGYPSLSAGRSNFQVYSQLQYPSTSNWGSMKRGKRSTEPPSLLSPASLLPPASSLQEVNKETPYSVQYLPKVIPVNSNNNNKPTKV